MISRVFILFLFLQSCFTAPEKDTVEETLGMLTHDLLAMERGVPSPIAVGDFLFHGNRCDLGEEIEAALPALLSAAAPDLDIVSHKELEAILEQQKLNTSDLFDSSGPELGGLLAGSSLVLGSIFQHEGGTWIVANLVEVGSGRYLSGARTFLPGRILETLEPDRRDLPLEVEFQVFARRSGSDDEIVVRDGTRLKSGDRVRMAVRINRPAHLYVFFLDSQGQAHFLHPRFSGGLSIVSDQETFLPQDRSYFRLDRHPGTESLLVAAALDPLEEIEDLLVRLDEIAAGRSVLMGVVKELGIKGFVGISGSPDRPEHLPAVLRSYSGVAWRIVNFTHLP